MNPPEATVAADHCPAWDYESNRPHREQPSMSGPGAADGWAIRTIVTTCPTCGDTVTADTDATLRCHGGTPRHRCHGLCDAPGTCRHLRVRALMGRIYRDGKPRQERRALECKSCGALLPDDGRQLRGTR